ncbi:hypothetical protein JAAARDRAFT_31119 [Jaapia argillacea MUCL 33604]|uniref:RRM Nup35-type domain-containing protein n=1 Tax=Jaapia argillacea MUCL 33604 TaxID=933084 RepID=A0A067Q3U6_9AGAM|nr:hypothetical protein JAAARDRAFT_31119 [Jaapia argillacea MUCL 33604]
MFGGSFVSSSSDERARSSFAHSSQSPPHAPQFSVAGMSGASVSHHGHSSSWSTASPGPTLSTSLSDPFAQSRTPYQPGYLMSMSPQKAAPANTQRYDEVPIVQTKAKMNNHLARGSASEFGSDSMFQSSRRQQTLPDEDAPPTSSINDMMNDFPPDSASLRFSERKPAFQTPPSRTPISRTPQPTPNTQTSQPLFVIVFGYPPDKYTATVEYFKSLGDTTDADPNTEILNCFRIGFNDPGEALRAVRKNGEVLGGCWMVGAKWADAAQAESLLGQSVRAPDSGRGATSMDAMAVDEAPSPTGNGGRTTTPSIGTPLKLAPSGSAFRKPAPPHNTPRVQQPEPGQRVHLDPAQPSPTKGMLGQVSDLIFGW